MASLPTESLLQQAQVLQEKVPLLQAQIQEQHASLNEKTEKLNGIMKKFPLAAQLLESIQSGTAQEQAKLMSTIVLLTRKPGSRPPIAQVVNPLLTQAIALQRGIYQQKETLLKLKEELLAEKQKQQGLLTAHPPSKSSHE